ncbi:MAG: RNA-binding protein [Lactobacillaceae bacterium]|jgi:RNA-binding protein YlmH|nr:RNA-binding protein [Lactobacillaceae bacterium]
MAENVEQHFRASERPFIDQSEGYIRQALDEYRPILTNFLNPRQRYILATLINRHTELAFRENGGYPDAESARVLIYPAYYQPELSDFEITVLEINYPTKFAELHHSTILGSMMHNGIERSSIGDILTDDNGIWQLILTEPMARFVQAEIDHLGKTKIRFNEVALAAIIVPEVELELINTTVSSLRLDTIVANGYNVSRTHAKDMIEHGLVRVNWTEIERPDFNVAVNDLISVRRYGRIKLLSENGLTKKEKWRVELAVIKK